MAKQPFELRNLTVLIADHNGYLRRITRTMLLSIGIRSVVEAADGLTALDQIRACNPDVLLLDWETPVLPAMEVIQIIRTPGVFPRPNLPTVMLTSQPKRSNVVQAMRVGVHEVLLKPTSPQALHDRILSAVLHNRPMVKLGKYYVPQPRTISLSSEPPNSNLSASGEEDRSIVDVLA
jgi:two-component system, chemotaxis family, chemotaxis protein CheY